METPRRSAASEEAVIKVENYRWVIVIIFGIYSGINGFLFLQFSIIANITERYYQVSPFVVNSTGLVFMGFFVICFIPVGHFIEKNSLRTTSILSTGLTATGNILKLFATAPERFYLIIISQTFCGIGQVFLTSLPSKVACTWFGAEEVSTACALGVMGNQIGVALGTLVPTFMVMEMASSSETANQFMSLYILDNIISIGIFIIVLIFFRSSPKYPPSLSQAALTSKRSEPDQLSYVQAFKGFLKNRDYLLVLLCFGLSYGAWTSLGLLINDLYLHFFPGDEKTLGVLVLLGLVAGGFLGTFLYGYILDKTHAFKKVSFYALLLSCLSWLLMATALETRSALATYILMPLNGFFSGSLLVLGFEYAIETTYPVPEAFSASLLSATICLFAIIDVIVIQYVFQTIGYLVGQLIIFLLYAVSAFVVLFISPDLKRWKANMRKDHSESYGSFDQQ